MKKLTQQEQQELVDSLRPIDDAMFRVIAKDHALCEELLRTLLEMPELEIIEPETQYSVKSLNREVVLDALCRNKSDGTLYNIEIQKSDCNEDIRRVRFHASAITAQHTPKGAKFAEVPNVIIIYISIYDVLGLGKAVTKVRRYAETSDGYIPVNDGETIIFANTAVKEHTDSSDLLQLFLRRDAFQDERFPAFCNRVNYFKNKQKDVVDMTNPVWEKYAKRYAEEYAEEVTKEMTESMILTNVRRFLKLKMADSDIINAIVEDYNLSKEQAEQYLLEAKKNQ